jgi:hypothetical protein
MKAGQKPKPRSKNLIFKTTIPQKFFSQGGKLTERSGVGGVIENIIPELPNGFTHCIPDQCKNLSTLTLGILRAETLKASSPARGDPAMSKIHKPNALLIRPYLLKDTGKGGILGEFTKARSEHKFNEVHYWRGK